ncbi:hypothetical protein LTS07_003540 [Exophiala sideris]|uniref:Short-chain dehydrogenase n=1 Tax=Exophiala sideris TaxID=1016849 RepID=A0ABR0JIE7_9EURO|nr:hypothetical protein LTS07_003540 [Exophiala sideris]KAK5063783.1 hypothetical protein LTR69_003548 [Exophiala sideris]
MVNRLIVVLGSGPGLGVATGSKFAAQGFDVALLARNAERLQEDVATVQKAASNVKVQPYTVDISDHVALSKTLKKVEDEMGAPEVVYFNAARVGPSKIGETPPDHLLEDFKATGRPGAHPSFFLSNGAIYEQPIAGFFALSMQKAAQFNLTSSLRQILGPKGVHVAVITIAAIIRDDHPVLNPKNIAAQYWKLYEQNEDSWDFNVPMGDIQELHDILRGGQ